MMELNISIAELTVLCILLGAVIRKLCMHIVGKLIFEEFYFFKVKIRLLCIICLELDFQVRKPKFYKLSLFI